MRILIVDDDNLKIQRVQEGIRAGCNDLAVDVDCVYTIADAKRNLRTTLYDLMILDVVVPSRAGEPPRAEHSEALLVELRDRSTLKKPKQIIGLTAYEEGFNALQSVFASQSWAIIRYRQESNDWREQIARSVAYLASASSEAPKKEHKVDIAIISALESPEHDAVRRNGWNWAAPEPLDDTAFFQRAQFTSGDRNFSAVATYCHKFGMLSAALLSSKLIDAFRPRYIAMPGICAGVKEKANYGDVIIAEPCWDWQMGKHLVKDGVKEFAIQPEQLTIPATIRSKWDQLRQDRSLMAAIKQHWPGAPDTELKVRIGPSVSGAAVLADYEMVEKIKEQHRSLLAVEMEAYGLFSAAQLASSPRPIAFSCKAVCDFADEKKDDKWQTYAAYTSVAALTKFVERYMQNLV